MFDHQPEYIVTVPGEQSNVAGEPHSFAAGRRAKALAPGEFAGGLDRRRCGIHSDQRFVVRASGGARFYTASDLSSGVKVMPGSGSWSSLSDWHAKANFARVDPRNILKRLVQLPIANWRYKARSSSVRHVGPTAQDFHAAFGVGEDEKHIAAVDADGVALAIQGLSRRSK